MGVRATALGATLCEEIERKVTGVSGLHFSPEDSLGLGVSV